MVNRIGVLLLTLTGLVACTKRNPDACFTDSDCASPARPFCDTDGTYPESHYTSNACSTKPANCPISRCGCSPGEPLSCAGDQATVCSSDGTSTAVETCALGCAASGAGCSGFTPSNGLRPALDDAAAEPDVDFPAQVRIDTDFGVIQDGTGASIPVKTTLVAQDAGQPSIRVFEAKSFLIHDATVSGTRALAFVAVGTITVAGTLDMSAKQGVAGPGAQESPALCAGTSGTILDCTSSIQSDGGGGGGNATAGGTGGASFVTIPGGALDADFTPLGGGCRGGDVTASGNVVLTRGGAGGGALQLVSLHSIEINGTVNLAGGGGTATAVNSAGGGSGGLLIAEAPVVNLRGPGGVVANGGAGGGCGSPGSDGTTTTSVATNPACSAAGRGGTGTVAPSSATSCPGDFCQQCGAHYAGGGGAVGRMRTVTVAGALMSSLNPTVSVAVSASTLVVH